MLHEVESNSCEAVAMGNHDLADRAGDALVQNGDKPSAAKVDPAADICNDSVMGILGPQEIDLPLQITSLLGARHSRVNEICSVRAGQSKRIARFAADGEGALEPTVASPVAKGLRGNAEHIGCLGRPEDRHAILYV